jgi:cytochrome c-type biogenesis protein
MDDPTVPFAFLAGLASFLSPCVLPLVPGYLSYMSGMGTLDNARGSLKSAWVAVAFVLGFTAVFVALGATATLLGSFLRDYQETFTRAGGVLIIAFGLIFMGVVKVPWVYSEARWHPRPEAGTWGAVVLGGAFAFGWSPCIGATMGAILTMAAGGAASGGAAEGAFLLAVYSLGLGVPFIVAGFGVSRLTAAVGYLRRHMRTINLISGALLIGVGILFLTDQVFQVAIWMQKGFRALNLDSLAEI